VTGAMVSRWIGQIMVALLAMLALAPIAPGQAAVIDTPIVSGLPWRSGADGDSDLGSWCGRPLDVRVVFVGY
jgi:hypothetical protein